MGAGANSGEGVAALNLRDIMRALRARWLIVCVTTVVAVLGAVAVTLLTTPLYQASTRLFVSTAAGGDTLTDKYQGTLFSQERVLSYSQLLTGETLAQRTVDKLGLDMSAGELAGRVSATATPDTVLIDVGVLDESPVRARDIANTLSDEFVAMARDLETPEDGSAPDARVVVEQRASIPGEPVTPKKSRNIAASLAVGLLLGVGLALLRNLLDNTVKDQQTLEQITGVGLVGSIPLDRERRKVATISFDGNKSAIAEAFRKLRTNLQFLAVDNPPRVIVVTSSLPNEGKTITAINIALALAEAEHNVLLVDGDLRRAMLGKYLNLVGSVGLSTVLSGGASVSEVLQQTGSPRLSVLTSGAIPPNPSELLGSLSAKKVLAEMRAQFDYVIVDSSPLLAVTDAAILAANSDGVLIMARFGHSKRQQLAQAVGNLKDVGAPLLGAVFTMTPARGSGSYSYSYYGDDKVERPSPNPPAPSTNVAQSGGRRRAEDRQREARLTQGIRTTE
jgi:capsular exopolysaccharide synthesis family protein